jgi:hypothetical protein
MRRTQLSIYEYYCTLILIVIVKGDNSNMNSTALVKQTLFTGYNRLTMYTESCGVSHHIKLHIDTNAIYVIVIIVLS